MFLANRNVMKINWIFVLLAMSGMLHANLFRSEKSQVEPSPLPEYSSISVSGTGTLYFILTDLAPVSKDIKVENGVLTVNLKEHEILYLHIQKLPAIIVQGDAIVKSDHQFNIEDLTVNASGNGKLFIPIKGKFVNVLVQDGAEVLLSGVVDEQHAIIQNKGLYEAASLFSQIATVTVNGQAHAMVNVMKELTANVSGDGYLQYGGDPGTVNKNVREAGRLKPLF